jgi:sugar/nucleoside kinase (ribokinase family)
MQTLVPIEPIDYLVIGHVTQDLTPEGPVLGGTASYAALTARALGLRVGIVTACAPSTDLSPFEGIQMRVLPADFSTTFENILTPNGRVQYLHHRAPNLDSSIIPDSWKTAPIVHLAPVAQEIEPSIVHAFGESLVGVTPQGWLRGWDEKGKVHFNEWPESGFVLEHASAAVLSIEDVHGNEGIIEEMQSSIRVLVVTEGAAGCRLYWNGDLRHFSPPYMREIDPTGAGDIFAAAFFFRLNATHDPWESARFATQIAANSVTRRGLLGVPTPDEVEACMVEIVPKI